MTRLAAAMLATALDRFEPVPGSIVITLEFDGDEVIGSSGCSAEDRFLEALAHVERYELKGNRLILSYRKGAELGTLLLAPADAGS